MTRSPEFVRDLAYYTTKLATQQLEDDALNAALGFPRTDLAYAEASKREARRMMPTSDVMLAQFRASVQLRQYAAAIGV